MLNQCQQLGSSVSELNDKYPGSCLCLLEHWNRELYTIILTAGVIISEHPTSGVVLRLFWLGKSKSIKTGSLFVGVMRLVTGLSEGRKEYSLEMYGAHDYLDAFPQSMVNSSSTILHGWLFYALVLYLMLLH